MVNKPTERGAALLTVLLLVAVISVLAATALERLRLATRIGGNVIALEQARAYSLAAETLALVKVSDLLAGNEKRVTLAGGWSGRPYPLPVPGGTATARVVDGGNCFNLNSLVVKSGPDSYASYPPAKYQLIRLIRLLRAPAPNPEAVAAAASDWIDTDSDPIEQGAEDNAYLGLATPYRTANTMMSDPSELRAVLGVTPALYAALRPWLCTLPVAKASRINVNTLLPEQAPLISMLLPETLSVDAARQLLLKRPPQGYESTEKFWQGPALLGIVAGPEAEPQTSVTTTWFSLAVDVDVGGTELEQHGLIDASALPARLATRQWGERS